jgi:hypothetical protein
MAKRRHHTRRRQRTEHRWAEVDALLGAPLEYQEPGADGPAAVVIPSDAELETLWADDVQAWDEELQTAPDLFDEPAAEDAFSAPGALASPPGEEASLAAPARRRG